MTRFSQLALVFLISLATALHAQDKISVESTIDKQTITIGDRITYTVKISSDTSLVVDSLTVGTNLGSFEVKDYKPRQSAVKNGTRTSTESFEITTFTTGDYQIPPVIIHYRTPSGEVKSVATDPLPIKVNSLLSGEQGEDIKPLKPQKEFPREFPTLWVIVGSVLIAGAALFFWLYRRARRPIDLSTAVADTRLPWEIALEELAKLRESDLLARGEYKLFYLELSDIFRRYLERRYGIYALERTTIEIIMEFRKLALAKEEEKVIHDFLEGCDLVKFAKYLPTAEDIERDYLTAKEFVIQTRSFPFTTVKEGE
jgi:hypothetical protein